MRRSRSRSPRDRDRDRSDARGGVRGRGPVDAPGHDRDRDRPRGGPPRDLLPGDRRDYRGGGGGGPPPRSSRSRSRSGGRRRSRSRSRDRDARDRRDGGKGAAAPPAPAAAAAPAPPAAAGGTRRDDRARSRSRSPRRRSRSPEPLRSKEEEELLELTRDARTVFVQQLVVRASERDVREYFEQVGPVSDVRLIRDRASGRSKGFGYVEFEDLEAVPKALLLNGQIMCMKHRGCTCSGFPVSVKPSQAEKNYAAMAEAAGGSTSAATLEKRVYIGNLSPAISEGDLKALATIIGVPDKVFLIRDSKGVSRGYAYIQFADTMMAQRALNTLHDQDVGGRAIKVGRLNNMGEVVSQNGDKFLLELGRGQVLTAQARAALMAQLSSATSAAAQELGSSLLALSADSTAAAAAAAAAAAGAAAAAAGSGAGASAGGPHGAPSPCLYLANLYDLAKEQEPEWRSNISEDVKEECAHFGTVLHVAVMGDSMGRVAIMFSTLTEAIAAATALAGRIFAGKTISVEYAPLLEYITMYPEAAAAANSA